MPQISADFAAQKSLAQQPQEGWYGSGQIGTVSGNHENPLAGFAHRRRGFRFIILNMARAARQKPGDCSADLCRYYSGNPVPSFESRQDAGRDRSYCVAWADRVESGTLPGKAMRNDIAALRLNIAAVENSLLEMEKL